MAGNAIGSLFIELGVNAGAFVEGLSKATYKAKQAAKEIGESISGIGKSLQGVLGHFGELGNVIGDVMGEAGETISKFSGQLAGMSGAAAGAAIGVTVLGAAVLAVGAAFGKMAIEGAEFVHSIDNTSQKTGIAAQDLLTLKAAGGSVGLGLDQMVQGFRRFDQSLAGTGRNTGAASVILKQLGVTSTDNMGALYQVADAFKNMENGPRKAADAIALFGRAGLQMIPFLNKGSEGLREFEALADNYGPKIGKDATAANEEYQISQQKLSLAWEAATVSAETRFLPTITKIVSAMADLTKGVSDVIDKMNTLPGVLNAFSTAAGAVNPTSYIAKRAYDQYQDVDPLTSEDTTKYATKQAHGAAQQANDDRIAKAKIYAELAQKTGETTLENGYRNLELMQQQEKVQELMSAGKYDDAVAAAAQLVPLREAAQLEDKINELRRHPVTIAPSADPTKEIQRNQNDQLSKQSALADSTLKTKDAIVVYTAEQSKRIEIDKKVQSLTDDITKQQGELSKAARNPQQQSEISQKIAELKRFRDELTAAAPDIIAKEGAIALAGQINKSTEGLDQQATEMEAQAVAVKAVAAAYMQGYDAIRNAEIDKAVEKQQLAVDQATQAYQKFVGEHGELVAALSPEKDALDAATGSLNRMRAATGAMIDSKLADKIQRDMDMLEAEANAYNILAAASGKGMLAQVNAEEAAARARSAGNRGSSWQEQEIAAEQARQKAVEGIRSAADQTASQYNLTQSYQDQIAKLELVKQLNQGNSEIQLKANAAEHDALQQTNRDWDQAALKVGDFNQQIAAMLNEIQMDGADFWSKFLQQGLSTFQGLEDGLAKFAVTGKGNFKQLGQQFLEGQAKNSISAIMSKGAGALLNSTGLGGLIPGLDTAKRDGSTEANALFVEMAGGGMFAPGGSLPGGGNVPSDALAKIGGMLPTPAGAGLGLVGSLGSILGLPFMAGGGDVTPGQSYVVGENHPEIFTPSSPGRIIPDGGGMGKGGNTVNNFHFNGVTDADSFKRSRNQIGQQITNMVGKSNGRR